MGVIQVYEHDTLMVGKTPNGVIFKQEHFASLAERLGKKSDSVFPFYSLVRHQHNDGIKFKQYVGAIQTGDLTIEILPKTDKGNDGQDWKSVLLFMLSKVRRLNIKSEGCVPQKLRSSTILDFVVLHFLNEVESIFHQGLVKTYRAYSENATSLQGKLLFSKHIEKNLIHKERFYVQHSIYDRSHVMNLIIKQALKCIADSSNNSSLRQRAHKYKDLLVELPDISVDESLFATLKYDRKTERYREAMSLSELILFNNMPDLTHGKKNTFAMLFDMNRLWEEFVYVTLRKYLPKNYSVGSQLRRRFWKSKHIKPDIVIKDLNDPDKLFVLDTKWKQPDRLNPADADLHQMYVYYKYFKATKVALLYPSSSATCQAIYGGAFHDDIMGSCDLIYLPVSQWSSRGIKWQQEIVAMILEWMR